MYANSDPIVSEFDDFVKCLSTKLSTFQVIEHENLEMKNGN